ncbi:WbuC family cupin fold metalloprotein [Alphaproteobacteria bacterium]|nr:WbuC family cupin fold metalloprotein [Alphaproteobacteria bacterium]
MENDEVLYPTNNKVMFSVDNIAELKTMAYDNPRKRVRLCCHQSPKEIVHEMIIVHSQECYVRPHSHTKRNESIYIIEGEADLVFFNLDGAICSIVELGDLRSGKTIYQKIPRNTVHTLIFHTPFLVFKEVTQGPFEQDSTIFPYWSPSDNNGLDIIGPYLQSIATQAEQFRAKK